MKKILLAPFLLASLFSFGGELKAHPENSSSRITPTASATRWHMIAVASREEKILLDFSGGNGCNGGSYYCKQKHNHNWELMDHWGFVESVAVPTNNIFYKSQAMCNAEGNKIKQFLENGRFSTSRSYEHTHEIYKPNDYDYINTKHSHAISKGYRIRVYFKCIKGTVDY